jgi:hypothetical protein
MSMQEHEAHMHLHCAKLAVRLILHGFRGVDDLAGLQPTAVARISDVPREQTLLTRIVTEVNYLAAQARSERLRRRLGVPEHSNRGPKSASDIADTLTPERLQSLEESNQQLQQNLGIQIQAGPRAVTRAMAAAKQKGQAREVLEALAAREDEVRLQSQRKSLAQVASGLRAWHAFAVTILDYDELATIPPQSTDDMTKFLLCFSNGGSAANYLSYIRWTCREYSKSLDWNQPRLGTLIKTLRKMDLQTRVAQLPEELRLPEQVIHQLIQLAYELKDAEWARMATLAWHFLFRVQSECIPLQHGAPTEAVTGVPSDRHSSAFLDESGRLVVRLKARKNRPQGSILMRECSCSSSGGDPRLCAVHCCDWGAHAPGDPVLALSSGQAKSRLRRYASLLGVQGAPRLTLKTFRASRATALAKEGKPIHAILDAGEWKSAAFLRYASPDSLDAGALLTRSVQESESESDCSSDEQLDAFKLLQSA